MIQPWLTNLVVEFPGGDQRGDQPFVGSASRLLQLGQLRGSHVDPRNDGWVLIRDPTCGDAVRERGRGRRRRREKERAPVSSVNVPSTSAELTDCSTDET